MSLWAFFAASASFAMNVLGGTYQGGLRGEFAAPGHSSFPAPGVFGGVIQVSPAGSISVRTGTSRCPWIAGIVWTVVLGMWCIWGNDPE